MDLRHLQKDLLFKPDLLLFFESLRCFWQKAPWIFIGVVLGSFKLEENGWDLIEQFKVMKDCSFGSQYKCSQLFGYKGSKEKIHEEDLISVIKFDKDG